jgi:hypothetical protein
MVSQADSPRKNDVVSDPDTPRHPGSCHDQASLADANIMGDVDQVIDLGAPADDGVVDTAPINRGVGTNLHLILDDAASNMRYPLVAIGGRKETKSRTADHSSGLEHDPIAQTGATMANHTRSEHAILTDGYPFFQDHPRLESGPRSHPGAVPQNGARSDAYVLTQNNGLAAHRGGMKPRRGNPGGNKTGYKRKEGPVRILDNNPGGGSLSLQLKLWSDQHGAGRRGPKIGQVPGRDKKRQRLAVGAIEWPDSGNDLPAIAKQAATDQIGDRLRG